MVEFYGSHVGKYTSPMDPMVNRETLGDTSELGFHLVVDYKMVNIMEFIPTMFESTSFILNMATFRSPGQKS